MLLSRIRDGGYPPDSLPTMTLTVTPCRNQSEWDALVDEAGGHPLQMWGWGEVKARYEWNAERLVVRDGDRVAGSAQVLLRRLPGPFPQFAYVPRGPQADPADRGQVLRALAEHLKSVHRPIALSVEPDWEHPGSPLPRETDDAQIEVLEGQDPAGWVTDMAAAGFRRSANTGLIPHTLIIDVSVDDEILTKGFTTRTRRYVRKTLRMQGVRFDDVASESELQAVLDLNKATAQRAGFAVHDDDYYRGVRDLLGSKSRLLGAWEGEELLAFVWLVVSGTTAFELYGGVNARGMDLRINSGLKFHSMTAMRDIGVTRYDFNGLLNDGISSFKRQFAHHENLLIGTWDAPLSPLYPVFASALPVVRRALKSGVPALRSAVRDPKGAVTTAARAVRQKGRATPTD